MAPEVRNAFQRTSVGLSCPEEDTRTKQSFKDECDINKIMNKWERTGVPPKTNPAKPYYGDFTNPDDYLVAVNQVLIADEAFSSLPSFLRARFDNQPRNYLKFLADPANQAEAVKLGLAKAPPPSPPAPTPTPAPSPAPEPTPAPSPIEGGE